MFVGVWDVPDKPVGWTARGTDQSDMVMCEIRTCMEVVRLEALENHMRLTHGMVVKREDDEVVVDTRMPFLRRAQQQ